MQFSEANKQLFQEILKNPELAKNFSDKDIANLAKGKKPSGYTWHHSQESGVLQLVKTTTHKSTGLQVGVQYGVVAPNIDSIC